MATSGRFISFEGSEGCGKSTQIARLHAHLEAAGHEVLLTREPGGTALGESIRNLLKHAPEGEGMVPEAELLLFTASRAQLVRDVIQPALQRGVMVLADRFLDSTSVYQGVARGLDLEAVKAVNGFAVGDCLPETTFLLDLDVATGRKRIAARDDGAADRMEREPDAFFEKVRAGYLDLAKASPDRFVVIDAAQTQDAIEAQILTRLELNG